MGDTERFSGRFVTQLGDFYHFLRFYTVSFKHFSVAAPPPRVFGHRFQIYGQIFPPPQALIIPQQQFYENYHPNGRYKAFLRKTKYKSI